MDDFGLRQLNLSQDEDSHDIVAERHERKSPLVTARVRDSYPKAPKPGIIAYHSSYTLRFP